MREFTVPPAVTVGDHATLTDPVWDNAAAAPDAVQFQRQTGAGWQDVTCAQFHDEVVTLARGLLAAGIEPGERVALMSKTRYEWTLIDYAIWSVGAVTVPIYETSSAEQVAWILEDSGAVACFVETDAHRDTVAAIRDQLPAVAHVWQIDGAPGAVDVLGADGAAVPREDVDRRRAEAKADDLATIIYTSGTTGRPKGCMITHRNMLSDIVNAIPELQSLFHQGARTLLFLPLAHSFARLIQIGVVQARATMGHTADTKNLAATLQTFRPTFVLSVPRVFEKVYNTAKQRAHADGKGAIFDRAERVAIDFSAAQRPGPLLKVQHALFDRLVYSKLRAALGGQCGRAISGGAPLGERLAHFYRGIGVTIFEGYGLTETSPATNANRDTGARIGTVGRPLPGVTIRIDDDGEILVQGDIVFKGYWNNPAATAEAIDADGWFHTGDIGELDDDGYLRITGRKKELIVTAGGKNVAPAVLEDRVRAHPLVSQCMVVGDRQPFIAALVTIDPDALPAWASAHGKSADIAALTDDAELRAEIQRAIDDANTAVSKAEAIKVFRILPQDFTEATGTLTPSLKVKRNVVLKEYAGDIAAIYER
ncbi:long-chain fatty acid--CoA ligase [Dactylosporangium aurantiacum]|uniref:Acyl-CoA synthetase n=1 Tax=Dactylosporangium aurantiacum TaxID=35754 RepID=A0A9Q9MI32_9ACTN|nr:long-chain fatty acid--CoA ligase [Dactylosporangium aurantiacum]MDG6102437.1 long-chain fatty acid--CoA ligase [Dactylosporangium aurantiacum]UWZ53276.1 long-chain fatty acid--CoA ligase [Dactylosporangium aurantiacum]